MDGLVQTNLCRQYYKLCKNYNNKINRVRLSLTEIKLFCLYVKCFIRKVDVSLDFVVY